MALLGDEVYYTDHNSRILHVMELPVGQAVLPPRMRNISLDAGTLFGLTVMQKMSDSKF